MAEIKIEKKKSIWPWIIVGLVIVGIIIALILFNNNSNENAVNQSTTSAVTTGNKNNEAIAAFSSFINSDTAKMGKDHEYTSGALSRLIQATRSVADEQGYDIKVNLDQAQQYADQITQDPNSLTHANSIKKAADLIASALQNLQRAKFPQLSTDADKVKTNANDINPDVETLNQKQQIKSFFYSASDLLHKMD